VRRSKTKHVLETDWRTNQHRDRFSPSPSPLAWVSGRRANREVGQFGPKTLGLTRGQVLGKMHRLVSRTKNQPRKWLNTALVEKLTELTDQRLGQRGQALGLTRCQVTYRMRHLGLRTKPKTEWSAWQAEKITRLINQGLSHGGIAKALGLTRGQVLGRMRRLGLKTKNAADPNRPQKRPPAKSGTP
jgi:hypothetical protein